MLKTKCIYEQISPEDGYRISIMSRHTLDDGITQDPRIDGKYDKHERLFSPPLKLLGDYYKRGLSWEKFVERYLAHVKMQEVRMEVLNLALRAINEDITLLCKEDTPEKCHRRLLAEECKILIPKLEVRIN